MRCIVVFDLDIDDAGIDNPRICHQVEGVPHFFRNEFLLLPIAEHNGLSITEAFELNGTIGSQSRHVFSFFAKCVAV